MGLETGTYISDLVTTNPAAGDSKSEGDDHIRLLKSTIKNTFPSIDGAVSATDEELSGLAVANQADASASIVAGTNWSPSMKLRKVNKTFAHLQGFFGASGSAGNPVMTLPVGYRPTETTYAPYINQLTKDVGYLSISTLGAVSLFPNSDALPSSTWLVPVNLLIKI